MKINKFLVTYLIIAFPMVLILIIWSIFHNQQEILHMNYMFVTVIWEILSWHLIIWFCVLIYLLCALVFSENFRIMILAKLTRIKERDEREKHITGTAGKFTFFSTLAVLLFLFFLFSFNLTVAKLPPEKAVNGKQMQLSIGFSFQAFEKNTQQNNNANKQVVFSTQNMSLSKTSIILLLIIWHIGSFYFYSRKVNIT